MEKLFKIIIIGDPTVGKTSYIQRYVHQSYQTDYKGTIGVDFALKVVKWTDSVSIKLQLWDIAGQERFTSMTRVYYKDAHACVIMFDLSQRSTFENALKWKKDLDSKCTLSDGSPVPCILLANKCDLPYREVQQAEIEDFCREQNFIGWTETSVLQGLMVEEPMRFLLEEMMSRRGELGESSREHGDGDDLSGSIKLKRKPAEKTSKCSC